MKYKVKYKITQPDGTPVEPAERTATIDYESVNEAEIIDMGQVKDKLWPERHESGLTIDVVDIEMAAE